MKTKLIIGVFLIDIIFSSIAFSLEKVSFFTDTVSEIDGKVIKMMSGSTWIMENEIIALPLNEAIILTSASAIKYDKNNIQKYINALPKKGKLIYQQNIVKVDLLGGMYLLQDGYLGKVVKSHGKGSVLQTEEGYMWSIPDYDQYDTGWWLPPYPVLIYGNEMYLVNLEKGKKVWIEKRIK